MAERIAHLASTTQNNPSIFDFIAQENLNYVLHLALKKAAESLYISYPSADLLWRWFEESYCVGSSLLQYYYLKKYGSTFAETFYGLRRVPFKDKNRVQLNKKEIFLTIVTTCLIPYIRNKLNAKSEDLYFSNDRHKNKKLKSLLLHTNSSLQVMLQVFNFIQHIRYLGGNSEYNSPWLWLVGLTLKYAEVQEKDPFTFRTAISMLLQRSFEISAFFMQFCHSWVSENNAIGSLPVPPPPEVENDEDDGMCPICLKKRQGETAISVSGYVFCFQCISNHIKIFKQCPISKIPATFDDLIRIYPPDL